MALIQDHLSAIEERRRRGTIGEEAYADLKTAALRHLQESYALQQFSYANKDIIDQKWDELQRARRKLEEARRRQG